MHICEHCCEIYGPEHEGYTVKRGPFAGAWLCTRECKSEFMGSIDPWEEQEAAKAVPNQL